MKQKPLNLCADDLVRLCVEQIDGVKGDCTFQQNETLLDFATSLAKRFGASTKMYEELILLSNKLEPHNGLYRVTNLAQYASPKMKEQIFAAMLDRFGVKDAERVIKYATDILKRELTYVECETVKQWYGQVPNISDKKGRQIILEYIAKKYPERAEGVRTWFKKEDKFWNGAGQLV